MIQLNQRGFIAITTTMILSVILLVVATSLSFSGFFTRYNILDSELKKVGTSLAEGCVDQALLKLATDPSYIGNEVINIGGNNCTIKGITGSSQKTIKTDSNYKNYQTNLIVVVNTSDLSVVSWEEVASP